MADVTPVNDSSRVPRSAAAMVERAWIWSVVGYTVLRFVVAWGAFGDHGVNVWIFGLLDVGTAWPYAKAVATICRRSAAFEWRRLPIPILVAIVSFFAPYAYLWLAAGEMPAGLRAGLALFVVVVFGAAVLGVVSKVRKLRAGEVDDVDVELIDVSRLEGAGGVSHAEAAETALAVDDVVIDLRYGEARVERTRVVSPAEPVIETS